MATYYKLTTVDVSTQVWAFYTPAETRYVKETITFDCGYSALTETQVQNLSGIQSLNVADGTDYLNNVSDWLGAVVGSRPPKIPK